jgi:glutathione S-transferase
MKFYYSPGACSLASHIVLEELKLPYEPHPINIRQGQQKAAEFLAINSKGVVPTLELDDGNVLTENLAILLYLAELKPEAKLIPTVGTLARARCYEWLSFIASDMHKAFVPLFKPAAFVSDETAQQDLISKARQKVEAVLNLAEQKLTNKEFALGSDYSICDPYLLVLFQWAKNLQFPIGQWPCYARLAAKLYQRPAVHKALASEGLIKVTDS